MLAGPPLRSKATIRFLESKFLKLKTLKLDGCYPSIDSKFVLALINAGKETISTIYKKKEEICETLLNFLKNLSSVYQHM